MMTREDSASIKEIELLLMDMGFTIDSISLLQDHIVVSAWRDKNVGHMSISTWVMTEAVPRAAAVGWSLRSWDASREKLRMTIEKPRTREAERR